jgi:hypothetical protein
MSAVQLLGMAASASLLAGWRLYACVAALGLAMRVGLVDLPSKAQALDVLANPWVIGAAAIGALAEFFADKVMWIDTVWDGAPTLIRPLGGALIALAILDPSEPVWQVAAFLLGGGAALITHTAKTATRAAVNTSPEPFTNVAVSTAEDVAALGGLWLVFTNPAMAAVVAVVIVIGAGVMLFFAWRALRTIGRWLAAPTER